MMISLKTLFCVGCGCFVGGILRYLTGIFVYNKWCTPLPSIPWQTLIINMIGCLAMGIFSAMAEEHLLESPHLRAALTFGLCGGYSTLAAFSLEHVAMLKAGAYIPALFYTLATVIGGTLAFFMGHFCIHQLLALKG